MRRTPRKSTQGGDGMKMGNGIWNAAVIAVAVLAAPAAVRAQQNQAPAQPALGIEIDADDIGGVVTSRFGPEAGVWVIAETSDLGTRFAKIVVTDERGRYVMPDLPKANYRVWVRGYGLVDSDKVPAQVGTDNTLWLSNNTGLGGAPVPQAAVVGWINTKLFWQTRDPVKSQGWTPFIVD